MDWWLWVRCWWTCTGLLFGLGVVWLICPIFETYFREVRQALEPHRPRGGHPSSHLPGEASVAAAPDEVGASQAW